jgi:hypothetical protein
MLAKLLDERGISTSTNPSALSGDERVVVVSRGQLTDTQVAVYRDNFNSSLLVLPLTTKLEGVSIHSDHGEESTQTRDRLFSEALTQGAIVYLYINPSHFSDSTSDLSDLLTPLLGAEFQDKLKDRHFAKLPAEYIQQWAVSLGNAKSEYDGGYK